MRERLTTIIYTIENTTDTAIKILKDETKLTNIAQTYIRGICESEWGLDNDEFDKNAFDAFDDFGDD